MNWGIELRDSVNLVLNALAAWATVARIRQALLPRPRYPTIIPEHQTLNDAHFVVTDRLCTMLVVVDVASCDVGARSARRKRRVLGSAVRWIGGVWVVGNTVNVCSGRVSSGGAR